MFATVFTYRARPGEDDAVIALHEDWQRRQSMNTGVYLAWMLLQNTQEPREFIEITYFTSEDKARAASYDLNRDAWYTRLVSLLEAEPVCTHCSCAWTF